MKACNNCTETAHDPTKVPLHQWDIPAKPWQCLQKDFAGPYRGKVWMLVMDVYSKWPEVRMMESTTAETTIKQLKQIFATHGLPLQIVMLQTNFNSFVCHREFNTLPPRLIILTLMGKQKDWFRLLKLRWTKPILRLVQSCRTVW